MTPDSNGPSGREWGEMANEVEHLKQATTEISLKLDDLPEDIVRKINKARADCQHLRRSGDHEKRLRRVERFFFGALGAVVFIELWPHLIEIVK